MDTEPTLAFPVIRGVQARREYYVAMWTLRMMQRISIFNEEDLPPELRAQRTLNKARIPEIAGYILDNPDDYVFSRPHRLREFRSQIRTGSGPG